MRLTYSLLVITLWKTAAFLTAAASRLLIMTSLLIMVISATWHLIHIVLRWSYLLLLKHLWWRHVRWQKVCCMRLRILLVHAIGRWNLVESIRARHYSLRLRWIHRRHHHLIIHHVVVLVDEHWLGWLLWLWLTILTSFDHLLRLVYQLIRLLLQSLRFDCRLLFEFLLWNDARTYRWTHMLHLELLPGRLLHLRHWVVRNSYIFVKTTLIFRPCKFVTWNMSLFWLFIIHYIFFLFIFAFFQLFIILLLKFLSLMLIVQERFWKIILLILACDLFLT